MALSLKNWRSVGLKQYIPHNSLAAIYSSPTTMVKGWSYFPSFGHLLGVRKCSSRSTNRASLDNFRGVCLHFAYAIWAQWSCHWVKGKVWVPLLRDRTWNRFPLSKDRTRRRPILTPMAKNVYFQIQSAAAYVCGLMEKFSIPFPVCRTKTFMERQPLLVAVLSAESSFCLK